MASDPANPTALTPPPPDPAALRVMGVETEYGISAVGGPVEDELHPMQLSNHVVKAYGSGHPAGVGLRDRDAAARHPWLRDQP